MALAVESRKKEGPQVHDRADSVRYPKLCWAVLNGLSPSLCLLEMQPWLRKRRCRSQESLRSAQGRFLWSWLERYFEPYEILSSSQCLFFWWRLLMVVRPSLLWLTKNWNSARHFVERVARLAALGNWNWGKDDHLPRKSQQNACYMNNKHWMTHLLLFIHIIFQIWIWYSGFQPACWPP